MKRRSVVRTAVVCSVVFLISILNAQPVTKIKAADVVINGDSFFALSGQIKVELEKLARADGYIGTSESFRNAAVSGAMIAGITNQYSGVNPKPVYVIMDGGGNDVLLTSCSTPPTVDCAAIKNAIAGVQPLLDKMAAGGTKKVLWMRYAEPGSNQAGVIKPKLDVLMPEIEKICRKSTRPKVMWFDLRPVWGDKGITGSYSSDGLHPTQAGAQATAAAFWKAIKDSSFFDTTTATALSGQPVGVDGPGQVTFANRVVSNNQLAFSAFMERSDVVTVQITTVAGRNVFAAAQREPAAGWRTVRFTIGGIAPGIYGLDVRTRQRSARTTIVVR